MERPNVDGRIDGVRVTPIEVHADPRGSATYELCGERPAALVFPRGLVHGWLFHEPTVHLQAVSESHDHYGADDNNGCLAAATTWLELQQDELVERHG